MAAFGASDAVIHLRSRKRTVIGVLIALTIAAGIVCERLGTEDLQAYVALVGLVEGLAFFLLPAILPDGALGGQRRGPLRADRTGVYFRSGGSGRSPEGLKLLLRREDIRGLWIVPARDRRVVFLAANSTRHDVAIEVENDMRARSLLEALDLQRDRHAARFFVERDPLRTPMQRLGARAAIVGGAVAIVATVFYVSTRTSDFVLFATVPLIILYTIGLRRARRTTDVVLGTDGIVVRAAGKLRTIGLSDIASVRVHAEAALVELTTKEKLTLRFFETEPLRARDAFVVGLQHRLSRGTALSDHLASLLVRGDRSAAEWIRDIAVTAGTAETQSYRVAPVPEETLWRIVEHVGTDPTARIGAVLALGDRIDDEGRARLRDLAGATSRSDLRAAFEAAAAGASAQRIVDALDAKRRA